VVSLNYKEEKMRMKKVWITVITVVSWIVLCSPNTFAAFNNEEAIRLLDEKFLRGEISEERYKKLSKRYGSGKKEGERKEEVPAAHNLLKNPSFEEGTSNPRYPVANWDAHEWTGKDIPGYKYKHDKSVCHSGKASIYSECQPGTKGAWAQYYKQTDPSKTYYASVWLRGENVAGGSALIVDGGKVDGKRPCATVSGTFDWKKVTIRGIKPDANKLTFTIVNRGGKLWADDAVLKETGDVMP